MLKILSLSLLGIGIYLLVRNFFADEAESEAQERLEVSSTQKKKLFVVFRLLDPIVDRFLLNTVSGLKIENYRKTAKRKLISAGLSEDATAERIFSYKILLAIAIPLVTFLYSFAFSWHLNPLFFLMLATFGFVYPDLWLKGKIKDRHREIRRAMPFVVDLLTLSTEAGLDFISSMARVIEKAKKSAFVLELEAVLKDIQLGTTRAEALRKMAWRIDMPEISSFTAILITAEQMGSSIGKVLRQQSDQIRHTRFIQAEKLGAEAAQKILIPLIFLILPAVFIMIFGPILLRFVNQGL